MALDMRQADRTLVEWCGKEMNMRSDMVFLQDFNQVSD